MKVGKDDIIDVLEYIILITIEQASYENDYKELSRYIERKRPFSNKLFHESVLASTFLLASQESYAEIIDFLNLPNPNTPRIIEKIRRVRFCVRKAKEGNPRLVILGILEG